MSNNNHRGVYVNEAKANSHAAMFVMLVLLAIAVLVAVTVLPMIAEAVQHTSLNDGIEAVKGFLPK